MPAEPQTKAPDMRYAIAAIALAVLCWGILHAVGAVGYNGNPWRGVVVMTCCGGFLGLWAVLLAARRRKTSDRSQH